MRRYLVGLDLSTLAIASLVATGCGDSGSAGDASGSDTDTDTDTDTATDSTPTATMSGTMTTSTTATGTSGTDTDTDSDTDTTGPAGECMDASECEDLYGAAPCGNWECNTGNCDVVCADCTDADLDGYGVGMGCAGPDCDDADDMVFDNAMASCYSGPANTEGVGTCMAGSQTCTAGIWTPCVGEVIPSGEACNAEDDDCDGDVDEDLGQFQCGTGACQNMVNACDNGQVQICQPGNQLGPDNTCDGIDDDCDGAIDEHCVMGCVWVTFGGSANPDGTLQNPYSIIQDAIDAAGANEFVCVAQGSTCSGNANYAQDVTMRDGVHVYGGYQTNNPPQRCNNLKSQTGATSRISPPSGQGVVFPDTISSTTILDGFRINRANTATSTAVTVDGATGAVVSNMFVFENTGGNVVDSYGVNVIGGGEATVTTSLIYGGNGSDENIGVRAVGATVTVTNNCDSVDGNNRCDDGCGWYPSTNESIRGRYSPKGGNEAFGVLLDDAPNSLIEQSAICGNNTNADGSSVRVLGDATGVVIRGNFTSGWGGNVNSHGVWLEDCGGAAPWIVDNFVVRGEGGQPNALVDGIRAIGECHPVVDSNLDISGGVEGAASTVNGVYCGANANGASECVVLGNLNIRGNAYQNFPPVAVGVRCDDDACNKIANNVITGNGGVEAYGLWIQESGVFVDDNVISGGCGGQVATGVYSDNSFARLQNNVIAAGTCQNGGSQISRGLHVILESGLNEIDVHSNLIMGDGNNVACTGYGIELDVTPGNAPAGPMGTFRNNIIMASRCNTAQYIVYENDVDADPAVFENNNLDPRWTPTALYFDLDTMALQTAAEVDALGDITVSGTLDVDSMFVNFPANVHIQGGSPCDGAGTNAGAPAFDFDGDARDANTPDIGADEI